MERREVCVLWPLVMWLLVMGGCGSELASDPSSGDGALEREAFGDAGNFHPGHYVYAYWRPNQGGMQDREFCKKFFITDESRDGGRFRGLAISYAWRDLEPSEGNYKLKQIEDDLRTLEILQGMDQKKRYLIIDLHSKTYSSQEADPDTNKPAKVLPEYILKKAGWTYETGQGDRRGVTPAWWNVDLKERAVALMRALGKGLNAGQKAMVEGIWLYESAVSIDKGILDDVGYDYGDMQRNMKEILGEARAAFGRGLQGQFSKHRFDGDRSFKDYSRYLSGLGYGIGMPNVYTTLSGPGTGDGTIIRNAAYPHVGKVADGPVVMSPQDNDTYLNRNQPWGDEDKQAEAILHETERIGAHYVLWYNMFKRSVFAKARKLIQDAKEDNPYVNTTIPRLL